MIAVHLIMGLLNFLAVFSLSFPIFKFTLYPEKQHAVVPTTQLYKETLLAWHPVLVQLLLHITHCCLYSVTSGNVIVEYETSQAVTQLNTKLILANRASNDGRKILAAGAFI